MYTKPNTVYPRFFIMKIYQFIYKFWYTIRYAAFLLVNMLNECLNGEKFAIEKYIVV